MSNVFYSRPARIVTYIAIPVILLSQYSHPSTLGFITQILMYGIIAYNAECLNEGGCEMWSWMSIVLPIVYSVLYIFFGTQLGLVAQPPTPMSSLIPISTTNVSTSTQLQKMTEQPFVLPVHDSGTVKAANTKAEIKEPMANVGYPNDTTGTMGSVY